MAETKLSFVEDMWDGIETIKEKTDTGLESCKDVLDFFRRLATVEEEYAKNMEKLLQRYQKYPTTTTLSQAWKGVINILEGQGSVHKSLSTNLVTNLCHPLQALLKDMETRRKQLVTDGTKHKTDLTTNTDTVKRAKLRYEKAAKDVDIAKAELAPLKAGYVSNASNAPKMQAAEKKVSAAENELSLSESQYKTQISIFNNYLDAYTQDKWPYVLNEFEQFEVTRISFMKAQIYNFVGLMKEMPAVLETEITAGVTHTENIDPEKDVQTFIETNKAPKEPLQPLVFEQYVPEKNTGTVREKSGSVSLGGRPISQLWDSLRGSKTAGKDEIRFTTFGQSLMDLLDKQRDDTTGVPRLLSALTEGIITLNGLNTEGIFRLAGSATEVQNVRKQLDKGDYNLAQVADVHVLGTVYKQMLRELPEAVIPTSFYDDCVSGRISPVELLDKLPSVHKVLLRSPQKDPTALLAGLTNELHFIERLILNAPPLDANLFPILAGLHMAADLTSQAMLEQDSQSHPLQSSENDEGTGSRRGSRPAGWRDGYVAPSSSPSSSSPSPSSSSSTSSLAASSGDLHSDFVIVPSSPSSSSSSSSSSPSPSTSSFISSTKHQ